MNTKRRICFTTIDCDPWDRDDCNLHKCWKSKVQLKGKAILELFSVFDSAGLKGKVTWFLNEMDVGWSSNYPDIVKMMVKRGNAIALHTHCGGAYGISPEIQGYKMLYGVCSKGKANLEAVSGQECFIHRFGCYYQSLDNYKVLERLGFRVVSDVFPGLKTKDVEERMLDNTMIPLGAFPWRHSASNWLDFKSREGPFLHIPVTSFGFNRNDNLISKVKSNDISVITWGIHPSEIQDNEGNLNKNKIGILKTQVLDIRNKINPTFANFNDAEKLLKGK